MPRRKEGRRENEGGLEALGDGLGDFFFFWGKVCWFGRMVLLVWLDGLVWLVCMMVS